MINLHDLREILPMLIIAGASLVALMLAAFAGRSKYPLFIFSLFAVVTAMSYTLAGITKDVMVIAEMVRITPAANAFSLIAMLSIFITIIASKEYLEKFNINYGEYYAMLFFALLGMQIMIYANDLILIFIGLETMSICFYVLAGMMRTRPKSNESAMKYLLLGMFMTGFLLYGMSLMYGSTGSTKISMIITSFTSYKTPLFLIGAALFTIGFLFKIGVFPFQMWIPDVYEGAPTIVSGMMSTAGKIAAVGTLAPIVFALNISSYKILFSVLATLTMLYGNILALTQSNLKRLLAYSSIASAGYILVGITSMDELAKSGIAFYLLAYVFMQLGAFIVAAVYENSAAGGKDFGRVTFDDYKGLAKTHPFLATVLTAFLFSLAGIPPFAGFWGKYYIFYAAIKSDLIWLSVIAILLSVVSVYYYLKVIVYMWFKEPEGALSQETEGRSVLSYAALGLSIAGTLAFGIFPELFFNIFKLVLK